MKNLGLCQKVGTDQSVYEHALNREILPLKILLLFVEMGISDPVFWSFAQLQKYPSAVIDAIIFFSLETPSHLRGRETIRVHR